MRKVNIIDLALSRGQRSYPRSLVILSKLARKYFAKIISTFNVIFLGFLNLFI